MSDIKNMVNVRRFQTEDAAEVKNLIVRNFLEVNSKDYGIDAMQKLAKVYGVEKVLRIRDNTELKENEYRISAFDNILFSAFIDENEEEPYKRIIDDVANVCDKHYAMILNKNIVKLMIDNLAELYPGIVDDIVPLKISYLQIKEELKKRVEEGKSIRNLIGILEDMEMNIHSTNG